MTIDKLVVNKQINIHGDTADIALQVQASSIPAADAKSADVAFEQFLRTLRGQKVRQGDQVLWTNEERETIRHAPNTAAAVEAYKQKFPDSKRGYSGISRMYLYLKGRKGAAAAVPPGAPVQKSAENVEKPAPAPVKPKSPEKKAPISAKIKNLIVAWSPEEDGIIKDCKNKEAAWAAYHAKFPDSKRSESGVVQRYQKLLRLKAKEKPAGKTVKKTPPAAPGKDDETIINIKGAEGLDGAPENKGTEKDPETPVPAGSPAPAETPAPAAEPEAKPRPLIVTGIKVRQIGGRTRFLGLATVKRVNALAKEALVDIGNGVEWIPFHNLAPAMENPAGAPA